MLSATAFGQLSSPSKEDSTILYGIPRWQFDRMVSAETRAQSCDAAYRSRLFAYRMLEKREIALDTALTNRNKQVEKVQSALTKTEGALQKQGEQMGLLEEKIKNLKDTIKKIIGGGVVVIVILLLV